MMLKYWDAEAVSLRTRDNPNKENRRAAPFADDLLFYTNRNAGSDVECVVTGRQIVDDDRGNESTIMPTWSWEHASGSYWN